MAKEICQLYMPAFYRSYGDGSLRAAQTSFKAIRNAGYSGIYLIALWQDGGYDNGFDVVRYEVNPKFGLNDDYKNLVDSAHEMGLTIGVDIVPNHVAPGNVLAAQCLAGSPGYEDALCVVSKEESEKLTQAGVPSFFGKLAYSDFGDKYVRSTFADYGQLNVNWENKKVQEYFEETFARLKDDGVDFIRVDCGALLLEDVTKADPHNPFACMRPKASLEAIRKVSGGMPLFIEWFDPQSADLFNDMEKCWALDCQHCLTGRFNTEWPHHKLVPVFGGHDQMTFFDRNFDHPGEILARAAQCEYVFSDMQTRLEWRTEALILPGDEEYDASLENPNQRYRSRRPIQPVLETFLRKYG